MALGPDGWAWQNSHEFCYEGKVAGPFVRSPACPVAEFVRIPRWAEWRLWSPLAGGVAEFSRILLRAGIVAGPFVDRLEAAWQNSHEFCYEPGKWLAPSRSLRGCRILTNSATCGKVAGRFACASRPARGWRLRPSGPRAHALWSREMAGRWLAAACFHGRGLNGLPRPPIRRKKCAGSFLAVQALTQTRDELIARQ